MVECGTFQAVCLLSQAMEIRLGRFGVPQPQVIPGPFGYHSACKAGMVLLVDWPLSCPWQELQRHEAPAFADSNEEHIVKVLDTTRRTLGAADVPPQVL